MPFEHYIPRPLTNNDTRSFAPAAPGVYGLSNAKEWIFIGQADNIQATLLEHLHGPAASGAQATGFVFEVCSGARRSIRQQRLILEYSPCGNRRQAAHSEPLPARR